MDYRAISVLLTKAVGIWLVAYALIGLSDRIPYFFSQYDPALSVWGYLVVGSLPVVVPALAGVALFLFPATISNKIVRGEQLLSENDVFFEMERVVLSAIGVFLLFRTLSDAVHHSVYFYYAKQQANSGIFSGSARALEPEALAAIVATAAEFGVALWLVVGSAGLVRAFNKLRGRA